METITVDGRALKKHLEYLEEIQKEARIWLKRSIRDSR